MTAAAVLLLALAAGYAFLLGRFATGLRHVLAAAVDVRSSERPFVTVIVPARDEQAVIERCLASILRNTYPRDRFEIIVVDDLSEDETALRVRQMQAQFAPVGASGEPLAEEVPRLRLIEMPENLERTRAHKKRAITKGISQARGEIILCTDADCVVPARWIETMIGFFDARTALVSGPVLYPVGTTVARQVQALEFLGLVAVGAGAIGAGRPNLCNGANVAYRRSAFEAVGGFAGIDHVTSGDDELLMQKFAYATDWQVAFCGSRDATVLTEGAPTLRSFFEQRRRWASKGRHYPEPSLRLTVGWIFAFYVALLAATLALPFVPAWAGAVAAAWGIKVLVEASVLLPAALHFGRGRLLGWFLPAQLLHVPYIVFMGLAGTAGGYTWKRRQVAR